MSKKAFIFPGQGAQYVGMGKEFYEAFVGARDVVEEASDVLSRDLKRVIFEDEKALQRTDQCQVAIYVVSAAILKVVREQLPGVVADVSAGLSLGEYTALFAAGRIGFKEGVKLVEARGRFMQEACEEEKGCMRVVLGMEVEAVRQGLGEGVWIANLNCPGQVVIAGKEEAMEKVCEELKGRGAKRILPLEVAGAFHTPMMEPARERLEPLIRGAELKESGVRMVMNVPGDFVDGVEEMRTCLIQQVASTTHWEKGVKAMEKDGVKCYVEMGPGKSLAGMNRKIGVEGVTVSIEKVADLEALHAEV